VSVFWTLAVGNFRAVSGVFRRCYAARRGGLAARRDAVGAGYRGGVAQQAAKAVSAEAYYPGKGLELPRTGRGSVASMARRFGALLADWLLCTLIAYGLLSNHWWTIVVFAVENYLLTAVGGMTIGQRLFSIRVVKLSGGMIGFGWAALRTLLILTVLPALFTDTDLRGLHDRATDTVVVRL
jgi:hypothetical protein